MSAGLRVQAFTGKYGSIKTGTVLRVNRCSVTVDFGAYGVRRIAPRYVWAD